MSSQKTAKLVPQPDGTQPEEMMHISSFAFIKKGGSLLLLRRVSPERWKGKWCIPGAVINYGEDPAMAAMRVVKEQTGGTATSVKLLDVQSYGTKHWDLCFLYEVETSGGLKLGKDFDKSDYFDPSKLAPEVREDHKEVIEAARARKVV